MIDWFVVLVPLVLLPIVLLFVFVGCQLIWGVEEVQVVYVGLDISSGCDTGVSTITVTFKTNIAPAGEFPETFSTTLSTIPSAEFTISTPDLKIKLEDEGTVDCLVSITPLVESPVDHTATHEKVEDEPLDSFKLVCQAGTFLLT
jgi:hypothetical protein